MKCFVLLTAMAMLLAFPAARALDTDRAEIRSYIDALAKEHGLDPGYLKSTLAKAQSQQGILDAMARPAEKTKPWHEYRDIFVTPERIRGGVKFWNEHEALLQQIAEKTGVPAEILVSIVGVETYYGDRAGSYRLVDSLATLGFDYPPRSDFFRAELTQLFLLAREEGIDISKSLGSYAGAMGAPQFMPSSYRHYAVDGDGDGRRDLFNNWNDVLSSVANYFVAHKWRTGEPVIARATEVTPQNQEPGDNKLSADFTVAGLKAQGLRFSTDLDESAPAGLVVMAGNDGTEYWAAFHNFYVITRYNRSSMYALAVYQLGQAIGEAVRTTPDGPLRTSYIP